MRICRPILALIWGLLLASSAFAQQLTLGRFHSRAVLTHAAGNPARAPLVILIPGSGPNGPEEFMPPSDTVDGKFDSIFAAFSEPLNQAGLHTLAIGKPGVDYFGNCGKDVLPCYYDQKLYNATTWENLIENVQDAVTYARNLPEVDRDRIFLLGHSQGTQVAPDYARRDPRIAGLILLGYEDDDMSTLLNWQISDRLAEDYIERVIDLNHDGYISKAEATKSGSFSWDWAPGQDKVSLQQIETYYQDLPANQALFSSVKNSALYSNGEFTRGPIHDEVTALTQPVYVFTGSVDEQTPPSQALALEKACKAAGKSNCYVQLVPGLCHGFSPPRPPRADPVLDLTIGPVEPSFQKTLLELGKKLF